MNDELKAKYESLHSLKDAYQLAKDGGFTGSAEDFVRLCIRASEELSAKEQLNLDEMESIAGGNGFTDTLSDVVDWCQENPAAAIGIGVGAVVTVTAVAVGISYGIDQYRRNQYDKYNLEPKYQEFLTEKGYGDPARGLRKFLDCKTMDEEISFMLSLI